MKTIDELVDELAVRLNSGQTVKQKKVAKPVSAPKPNWAPSVKAVETLVYIQAASTILVNNAARSLFSVTMHSLCLELFSWICLKASSKLFTVLTAIL